MKIYAMALNLGDGESTVAFFAEKPDENDPDFDWEYYGSGFEAGKWLTFPDDFDLKAAGINVR